MTLTHNNSNNWADGVLDQPKHNGLTQFGKEIIKEILIDLIEFEKSGDWYYFAAALDSLNELINELNKYNNYRLIQQIKCRQLIKKN